VGKERDETQESPVLESLVFIKNWPWKIRKERCHFLAFEVKSFSGLSRDGKFQTRKGEPMRKKTVLALVMASIPIFLVLTLENAQAQLKVGDQAPSFTLPSSQDRLVD